MKKLLVLILCLLFIITTFPAAAFAAENTNSAAAIAIVGKINRLVGLDSAPPFYTGFPDYFAGAYVSEGKAHVLVTRDDAQVRSALTAAAGTSDYTIHKVTYSLNELNRVRTEAYNNLGKLRTGNPSVYEKLRLCLFETDLLNNRVKIDVPDLDDAKIALFRQYVSNSTAIVLGNIDTTGVEFVDEIDALPDISMDEFLLNIGAIALCAQVNESLGTVSSGIVVRVSDVLYQKAYERGSIEHSSFTIDSSGAIKGYSDADLNPMPAKAPQMVLILCEMPTASGAMPTAVALLAVDAKGKLTLKTGPSHLKKYEGKVLSAFVSDVNKAAGKNEAAMKKKINAADGIALMTVSNIAGSICTLETNRVYKGINIPTSLTVPAAGRKTDERLLVFLQYNKTGRTYSPRADRGMIAGGDRDFYFALAKLDKLAVKPFAVPKQSAFGAVLGYAYRENAAIGALDSRFTIDAAAPSCAQTRLVYEWKRSTDVVGNAWLDPFGFLLIYRFTDEKAAISACDNIMKTPVYESSYDVIPVAMGERTPSPQEVGEGIVPWLIKGDTIVCIQKGSGAAYKTLKSLSDMLVGQGYRPMA